MKINLIVLSLLFLQSSASFFDEFRGTVSSVEDNFQKLLTDVVSEVKDTIDCAILAVEKVISLGAWSDYDLKCKGEEEQTVASSEDNEHDSNKEHTTLKDEIKTVYEIATDRGYIKEITQKINLSIDSANKSLCAILNQCEAQAQLRNVKSVLKNETNHLNEVSALLKQELGNISKDIKDKFIRVDLDKTEPSIENVWNEMKILHEVEDKYGSETKQVSNVFDEALSLLHDNKVISSDDDKIEEIITDLQKETNETIADIDNQFSKWKDEEHRDIINSSVINEYQNHTSSGESNSYPKTFRDVAKRIILSEPFKSTTEITKETVTSTTETSSTKSASEEELYSFFDLTPTKDDSHKAALEQAHKIIDDNTYSEMVMNSYLNSANYAAATNIFDNPGLLGFD